MGSNNERGGGVDKCVNNVNSTIEEAIIYEVENNMKLFSTNNDADESPASLPPPANNKLQRRGQ